ncbi:MAG: hypothetical protein KA397_01025 [Paludibacteraceae bacterium]|nr:hypothetical protein [Paludibacteraceae bacterium]MBP6284052.1 hypothetical protein [Paludibacteraceae bacterium]
MTIFDSEIKTIHAPSEAVFAKLTNIQNLDQLAGSTPHEKLKISRVTADTCFFEVDIIGEIGIKLVDKKPNSLLFFQSEQSPMAFNLSINLTDKQEDTDIHIQLKADLPMMIKMMASEPINKFINILADTLTTLSY